MTTRDEVPDERAPANEANPLARLSWAGVIQLATRPFREASARRRFLIGVAVALVPFVGPRMLAGHSLRVTRHLLEGEKTALPEWDDILDFVLDAVRIYLVFVVLTIPAGLLDAVGMAWGDSVFLGGAAWVLQLLALAILPLAILRLARNEFGAAFRIGSHVRRIRRQPHLYKRLIALLAPMSLLLSVAYPLALSSSFLWLSSGRSNLDPLGAAAFPLVALGLVLYAWTIMVAGAAIGFAGRLMEGDAETDDPAPTAGTP